MDKTFLAALFDYDAEAGSLIWKPRARDLFRSNRSHSVWNKRFAGKPAGSVGREGYVFVKIVGTNRPVHRVIWLLVFGTSPDAIDHINGDRSDNRLSNLREVSIAENNRNARRRRDNKSGVTGVDWRKAERKWRAQIAVDGRDISLGYYHNFSEAVAARRKAEAKYGFHVNHGRSAYSSSQTAGA